jgi:hypothetical protein
MKFLVSRHVLSTLSGLFVLGAFPQPALAKDEVEGPKLRVNTYSDVWNYKFGNAEADICIAKAIKMFTQNKFTLGPFVKKSTKAPNSRQFVYAWTPDGKQSAEIKCDSDKNETKLEYGYYGDMKEAWENWERLRKESW